MGRKKPIIWLPLAAGLVVYLGYLGCKDCELGWGPDPCCLASKILYDLDKDRLLVGANIADEEAARAPLDIRAVYLAGGLADGSSPCDSCQDCTADGQSCSSSSGGSCTWWGCWQWDQEDPGAYVRDFIDRSKEFDQIPLFTYYEFLHSSGASEGSAELAKLNDLTLMSRYFNDWRFLLENIGDETALLHIEPDLWGFAQKATDDPTQIPVRVSQANSVDCEEMEDNLAGFGQCLIAMVRAYAPNAKVGQHASGWATRVDALYNRDPDFDVEAEAQKVSAFLKKCGSSEADFVAVDISDRDAGYYETQGINKWWDDSNASLPNFHQGFAWSRALAYEAGLPILWWQIPLGNMTLENTYQQWKDNRLDYFFAHTAEVAESIAFGMVFGAGAEDQTNPSTDDGNFLIKARTYHSLGGQKAAE